MKEYPAIIHVINLWQTPNLYLHTFDKLDGSNLRFEWSRKRGWWKYGTRTRLFDKSEPIIGQSIEVFEKTMAEPLAKYIVDERIQNAVAFVEFYGKRSYVGIHHPEDEKHVVLLDIAYDKGNLIDTKDYIKLVEKTGVPAPKYFGLQKWNESFLLEIFFSKLEGITFEGVVGKDNKQNLAHPSWRQELVMFKFKTEAWKKSILDKFEHAKALALINS